MCPAIFFICELFYFIFTHRRAHFLLRLPFEIVSMFIYPFIFVCAFKGDFINWGNFFIVENAIFILLVFIVLLCIIAYFFSSYRIKMSTPVVEASFNIFLTIGILINCGIAVCMLIYSSFIVAVVGNLPIILAFGMALIDNLRLDPEQEISN